jgi:hypothetical protein
MKVVGLFKRFDSEQIKREIEEELLLHLELLTQEQFGPDVSLEVARATALKRFGNIEQIKDQCARIRWRNNPLVRALKSFLVLVFLLGVLVRVFGADFHVTRVGVVLMAVGILGRLLVYLRGSNPSSFLSKTEAPTQLMLNEDGHASIAAYDQKKRTPVERIISDR